MARRNTNLDGKNRFEGAKLSRSAILLRLWRD